MEALKRGLTYEYFKNPVFKMICINCDHDQRCHLEGECFRIEKNFRCICSHYAEGDIMPTASIGADVLVNAPDLSPYFQSMIKRMMYPDKLSE